MKILYSTIFVLATFFAVLPHRPIDLDAKLHETALYPCIGVWAESRTSGGSGFMLKSVQTGENEFKNVFLTCAHVIGDEEYMAKVYFYEKSVILDTKFYKCKFYAVDYEVDLAIGVFFSEEKMPTAVLDISDGLVIGNDVFQVGAGLGGDPRINFGKITSTNTGIPNFIKNVIRTNVHTVPGDSGSALYKNYKVVGVVQAIRTMGIIPVFNMSYSIPMRNLVRWSINNKNAFEFLWTEKPLPNLPFWRLKYDIKEINEEF